MNICTEYTAQEFGLLLCQLTLTKISRHFSRAMFKTDY